MRIGYSDTRRLGLALGADLGFGLGDDAGLALLAGLVEALFGQGDLDDRAVEVGQRGDRIVDLRQRLFLPVGQAAGDIFGDVDGGFERGDPQDLHIPPPVFAPLLDRIVPGLGAFHDGALPLRQLLDKRRGPTLFSFTVCMARSVHRNLDRTTENIRKRREAIFLQIFPLALASFPRRRESRIKPPRRKGAKEDAKGKTENRVSLAPLGALGALTLNSCASVSWIHAGACPRARPVGGNDISDGVTCRAILPYLSQQRVLALQAHHHTAPVAAGAAIVVGDMVPHGQDIRIEAAEGLGFEYA